METLIEQRCELAGNVGSGEAFPGSKEWSRSRKAEKALEAFDALHPEVLIEIRARHMAKMKESFVARGID